MKKIVLFALCLSSIFALETASAKKTQVKNVIVMIGDGMGLGQLSYTGIKHQEPLFFERAQSVGLIHTHSASDKVTDSAAAATALACGEKTTNGMIGMSPDEKPLKSILEKAEDNGFATGLVATYAITHATPAGFIAHEKSRKDGEAIAADFLDCDIDLFIGGGRDHFEKRKDGKNISAELKKKGYNVVYNIDDVMKHNDGKIAALLAPGSLKSVIGGRDDMLPKSTEKSLALLKEMGGKKGFFVMIESSQIDGMGHRNNAQGIVDETIDFNIAIERAYDFADENPGTLVLVFADHETGGLTMPADGNNVKPMFSTKEHSGVMVPIFGYGAGAEAFSCVMDNTEVPQIIAKLMGIKW